MFWSAKNDRSLVALPATENSIAAALADMSAVGSSTPVRDVIGAEGVGVALGVGAGVGPGVGEFPVDPPGTTGTAPESELPLPQLDRTTHAHIAPRRVQFFAIRSAP